MSKYEEMWQAAITQQRNFHQQRLRCSQHAVKLINGFQAYCGMPSHNVKLLRWTGDQTAPVPYEEADPGKTYTITGAMQFNEEDGYWHFGVHLDLTQMQWITFGMAISDADGKSLVKFSGAKPRQIDLNDHSQCNAFYESIVEFVKECYRDAKPGANRIGFALGYQEEQKEEKVVDAA